MKQLLLFSFALVMITAPSFADKEVPPNIQRKYDRRLMEIKLLDKNKDGVLQAGELLGSVKDKFDTADANKDGVISSEEKKALIETLKNQWQEIYGIRAEKMAKRLESRYNNADTNEDNQISQQEYDAYFGARYQNFDRDGNGIITEKEYRTDAENVPRSYLRDD